MTNGLGMTGARKDMGLGMESSQRDDKGTGKDKGRAENAGNFPFLPFFRVFHRVDFL